MNHLSSYPNYRDVLNLDGIPIPMEMKYLNKFENQNNISVNVFGAQYDENNWVCMGTNEVKGKKHLLLYLCMYQIKYMKGVWTY